MVVLTGGRPVTGEDGRSREVGIRSRTKDYCSGRCMRYNSWSATDRWVFRSREVDFLYSLKVCNTCIISLPARATRHHLEHLSLHLPRNDLLNIFTKIKQRILQNNKLFSLSFFCFNDFLTKKESIS